MATIKKSQKGGAYSSKKNEAAFIEGLEYLKRKNTTKATPKNIGKAAGSLMKKGGTVKAKSGMSIIRPTTPKKAGKAAGSMMKCGGKMKKKK